MHVVFKQYYEHDKLNGDKFVYTSDNLARLHVPLTSSLILDTGSIAGSAVVKLESDHLGSGGGRYFCLGVGGSPTMA